MSGDMDEVNTRHEQILRDTFGGGIVTRAKMLEAMRKAAEAAVENDRMSFDRPAPATLRERKAWIAGTIKRCLAVFDKHDKTCGCSCGAVTTKIRAEIAEMLARTGEPEPAPWTVKLQYRDETGVHDFPTWRNAPITAGLLADIFDAYSGADAHNLVVAVVNGHLGRKTNG